MTAHRGEDPHLQANLVEQIEAYGQHQDPVAYQRALLEALLNSARESDWDSGTIEDLRHVKTTFDEKYTTAAGTLEKAAVQSALGNEKTEERASTEKHPGIGNPSPEFDATNKPVVASYFGERGVSMFRYKPGDKPEDWRKEYWAADLPEDLRMPDRVYTLMDYGREFGRTGAVPDDFNPDNVRAFYNRVYEENDLNRGNYREDFGTTLVTVDGWTLVSLGQDTSRDNRGSICFAIKGDVPYSEIIARGLATFPDVANKLTAAGITISSEPAHVVEVDTKDTSVQTESDQASAEVDVPPLLAEDGGPDPETPPPEPTTQSSLYARLRSRNSR